MLFTSNPEFVTGVYAALFIALILTFIVGLLSLRWMAAVMRIPTRVMMVLIALLCIIGAFSIRSNIVDVYVMISFGCLGYIMNLLKIPVAPLAFGLILGPMLEENLRRTLMISRGSWEVFIDRPIALGLLVAIVLFILAPFIKPLIRRIRFSMA
jgi:putative tricarboxylic transport membrane protein